MPSWFIEASQLDQAQGRLVSDGPIMVMLQLDQVSRS